MKRKRVSIVLLVVTIIFCLLPQVASCKGVKPYELSANLNSVQTKAYPKTPTLKIMKAALNVLQDDCFFIDESDSQLGFITASKEVDIADKKVDIKKEFGCSRRFLGIKKLFPLFPAYAKTEININLTNETEKTLLKLTIRNKVLNLHDAIVKTREVEDKDYYDAFYLKLDKELQTEQK